MKKYCTKCGHEFIAVGREVICPSCKAQAAEDAKKAAVLKAKRASWTGESVPVRISGRASTVIREFGSLHTMTFAEALDTLLRTSEYFGCTGRKWEDVTPYKSHRRDKHATEDEQDASQASKPQDVSQDVSQDVTSKPQEAPHDVKQAAKTSSKTSTSKTTSKTSASKTSSKTSSKSTSKSSSK